MDKKTVKVIEKYSMPFVQLVLEKGEEDRVLFRLSSNQSKLLKKQAYLLF